MSHQEDVNHQEAAQSLTGTDDTTTPSSHGDGVANVWQRVQKYLQKRWKHIIFATAGGVMMLVVIVSLAIGLSGNRDAGEEPKCKLISVDIKDILKEDSLHGKMLANTVTVPQCIGPNKGNETCMAAHLMKRGFLVRYVANDGTVQNVTRRVYVHRDCQYL